jgi:hypothetical protein
MLALLLLLTLADLLLLVDLLQRQELLAQVRQVKLTVVEVRGLRTTVLLASIDKVEQEQPE